MPIRNFQLDRVKDAETRAADLLVAEGVEFEDGQVVLRWYNTGAITIFKNLQQLRQVHCSGGRARIIHNGHGTALTQIQQENLGHAAIKRMNSGEVQCQQCHLSLPYWEHFNIPCRFWCGNDARFPR